MKGSLRFDAYDKSKGMQPVEVMEVIRSAAASGFTLLGRTRVGFKGQILAMEFHRVSEDRKDDKVE